MHYTPITDRDRKIKLLDEMVDWHRSIAPVVQVSQSLTTWLVDLPVYWNEVTLDRRLTERDTHQWILQREFWQHSGSTHSEIGMAFAWYLSQRPHIQRVELGDSPDLFAELAPEPGWADQSPVTVMGDIGRCSVEALYVGLRRLSSHDMWISVRTDGSHIALVMDYNIGRIMTDAMAIALNVPLSDDTIRSLLTCKRCLNEVTEEQIAVFRQGFV